MLSECMLRLPHSRRLMTWPQRWQGMFMTWQPALVRRPKQAWHGCSSLENLSVLWKVAWTPANSVPLESCIGRQSCDTLLRHLHMTLS